MSSFLPPVSEFIKSSLRMLLGEDPSPIRFSDLVKLWCEENVNDPSVVSLAYGDPITLGGDVDKDVWELRLNQVPVAQIGNTLCVVRLKYMGRFAIASVKPDVFVAAADPELFEKLWAHIASIDSMCVGFSLIDKRPEVKPCDVPDFSKYPGFDEIK